MIQILKTAFILFLGEIMFPEETILKFVKPAGTSLDLTSFSSSQIPAVYRNGAPTVISFYPSSENGDILPESNY